MNFGARKQLEEGCSSSRRRLGTGSAAAPDVNKGGDGGKAARRRESCKEKLLVASQTQETRSPEAGCYQPTNLVIKQGLCLTPGFLSPGDFRCLRSKQNASAISPHPLAVFSCGELLSSSLIEISSL